MKYDLLIFIQAASDLRYALDIIDKNSKKKVHLYIIHVKSIYDFVRSLNLDNVDIDYQDYFEIKIKNPKTYFKAKKGLKNFWKEKFSQNEYIHVYFFSIFYDSMTASVIGKFLNYADVKIIYYDHYDTVSIMNDKLTPKMSIQYLKNKYISLVISYISEVSFITKYRKRFLEFDYKKYFIEKVNPSHFIEVNDKFKYKIKKDEKNMVFFISPDELKMLTFNSIVKLKEIFIYIKGRGYNMYIKGHPRLGTPKELKTFFDNEIPSFIPTEFLSYKEIDLTIGIMSSGLVYPSEISGNRTYSLINLLEFVNRKDKMFYYNFLKEHSKDKVTFINDIKKSL